MGSALANFIKVNLWNRPCRRNVYPVTVLGFGFAGWIRYMRVRREEQLCVRFREAIVIWYGPVEG